jgi:dolichyl-phosphate-mannose-protein mannosyltransferase
MTATRSTAFDGRLRLLALAGLLAAVAIRLVLLPTEGYKGDLDQFIVWVRDIAAGPLAQAYRLDLAFPPVMAYLFAGMGAIVSLLGHAIDAADPLVRAVVKTPASLADLGLAGGVAFALRDRPRWAVAAFLALALNPVLIYVSSWWGQFESIYVLAVLVSVLFARAGHLDLAAVALAVGLMTKPQAAFFVVPIVAWLLGAWGWRATARFGVVGLAAVAVLWLPFVPAGGIQAYAHNLEAYGNQTFPIASLRAWNAWWIMQEASGGQFLADTASLFGPISGRLMAFALAGLAELVVFLAVLQNSTKRNLSLGVAASVLVCFSLLTAMHERYAFGALVFLTFGLPERRIRAIWLAFSVVFMANLLSATPASTAIAQVLPEGGPISVVGSLVILGITVATLWALVHPARQPDGDPASAREELREPPAKGRSVPAQVVGKPGT